jgi:hypothetical protein
MFSVSALSRYRSIFATRLMLVFIACLAYSLEEASAHDLFVDNVSGDDRRNGMSNQFASPNSGPVKSITRALELARPGDRIIVGNTGVPYHESISLQGRRHSGAGWQPFQIISNGAVLDGSRLIPASAWQYTGGDLYRCLPHIKSHQMLFRDGEPMTRKDSPDQLKPGEWCMKGGWMHLRCESRMHPATWNLSCSALQTGITLYQCSQVDIAGLVVRGFALDGINAHDCVMETQIRRCDLQHNGRSGLSVAGSSHVRLFESRSALNSLAQARTEGCGVILPAP